ncbi:hypothetical protein ACFXPJ_16055, partial [Streptomyces goshikiensis]
MTPSDSTLAFVESPVQLLNVLEWAHAQAAAPEGGGGLLSGVPSQPDRRTPAGRPAAEASTGVRIVVL